MVQPEYCRTSDRELASWTFLRYLVLGGILLFRAKKLKENGWLENSHSVPVSHPFNKQPKLTRQMNHWSARGGFFYFVGLVFAGCIFIQAEGVGFVIYFAISALLDNFTIFIFKIDEFCSCVTAVAIYSMALVCFLPNCAFAFYFQHRWYDQGEWPQPCDGGRRPWPGQKILFIVSMVLVTVLSFFLRLILVYPLGWARVVNSFDIGVITAVIIPPIVDAIQAYTLIKIGLKEEGRDGPERDSARTLPSGTSGSQAILLTGPHHVWWP